MKSTLAQGNREVDQRNHDSARGCTALMLTCGIKKQDIVSRIFASTSSGSHKYTCDMWYALHARHRPDVAGVQDGKHSANM